MINYNCILGMLVMFVSSAGAITIPMKTVPTKFDPQKIETIYEMVIDLQIHRSLMKFNPNLSITPDLASSFEVHDHGKRLRFKLADRKFSNGVPIRAIHVVRTFQRLFRDHAGYAADLDYIVGATAILKKTKKASLSSLGVKAINERTVEFTLEKPVSIFLEQLASVEVAILPLDENLNSDELARVGAGPYAVDSFGSGELTLKLTGESKILSPGAPHDLHFVELSTDKALAAALRGQIDSLDGYSVSNEIVNKLKTVGWFETVSTITRQLFLVQNPDRVPPGIRKVIFDTIVADPAAMVPKPYIKSYGLIPESLVGSMSLLDLGIKTEKRVLKKVKLTLQIVQGEPALEQMGNAIKAILKPEGIDLKILVIPLKDYMPRIKDRRFDLLVRSKFLDYPDGMSILTYFRANYSDNTFFISDKNVDKALDRALGELNREKRATIYKEIQRLILSHKVVVPVVFGSDNRGLWGPRLRHVPAHPLGLQGLPMETMTALEK